MRLPDGTDYATLLARLSAAATLVPLGDLRDPPTDLRVVALRHDLCGHESHPDVLGAALGMARVEADLGVRATYLPMHSAPYFRTPRLGQVLREIVEMGHDLALHVDAVTTWIATGRAPLFTVTDALAVLADAVPQVRIEGAAAHGHPWCYRPGAEYRNYQCWAVCDPAIHDVGPCDVPRVPLASAGLLWEAYVTLRHDAYLSDSGGSWRGWSGDPRPRPFERVGGAMQAGLGALEAWERGEARALQVLVHPVWWRS